MNAARERAINEWRATQDSAFREAYPELARVKHASPYGSEHEDPGIVRLGYDDAHRPITLDTRTRLEHCQFIGATGSGKSTALEYLIKQDIVKGHGLCLFDPHGGHADSLFNKVLDFIRERRPRLLQQAKVHILSPNVREHVVGFNPLAAVPGIDTTVIADALLEAFERAWGDENTLEKPTIRTVLRATFIALAEQGLTIPDAKLLYDRADRHGLRARVIEQLQNEYARDELDRLHQLSIDPRARTDFDAQVIGPINRLNEFVSSETMATMLGMNAGDPDSPAKTIDIGDILDKGHILLVDLQHGAAVSKQNTDLLGKVLLRYLSFRGMTRSHYKPFFAYIDECHRFMTADIPDMLAQMRKYGIAVNLAHQWLSQLGQPGEPVYDAVIKGTATKLIFRLADQEEAERLAYTAVPLNLEMGVEASKRPVQIGHVIGWLSGMSEGQQQTDGSGTSVVESVTKSRAKSIMHSQTHAEIATHAIGTSVGEAAGSSLSHSDGLALQVDPLNPGVLIPATPLGQTNITSDVRGSSSLESRASNEIRGTGTVTGESIGEALTEGEAVGAARGTNITSSAGRSHSQSQTQALIPTYAELFTSFHSKDNMRYFAGRTILGLPTGRAILFSRGATSYLNVPAQDTTPTKT